MRGRGVLLAATAAAWNLAFAQAPQPKDPPPLPAFDVASVKPTEPGRNAEGVSISSDPELPSPGSFRAINNSLSELIRWAWSVRKYQLIGPNWLDDDSECFDIGARMPPQGPKAQARLMLQSLLAERFHLALHRESTRGRYSSFGW